MDSTRSVGVKFKVHISFARADQNFANRLLTALGGTGGFEFSVTPVEDTPVGGTPTAEWARAADNLIAAADAVIFILSPAAAEAPAVAREAELAQEMSKYMLAVLSQPAGRADLPAPLEDIKPIHMDSEQAYKRNLKLLETSLMQDAEWIRRHTMLYARARKWQAGKHDPSLLLAMPEVIAAKAWTFERPDKAPKPTDLHIDFIRISEEPETAPQNWPGEDVANDAEGGEAQGSEAIASQAVSPGVARRAASRFTALLRPQAKHRPAPIEPAPVEPVPVEPAPIEPALVEPAPGATLEAEPTPIPEVKVKSEPVPLPDTGAGAEAPEIPELSAKPEAQSAPVTAEKLGSLPAPDEWLDALPTAMPALEGQTRPAAPQPVPGLDLNRLAHVPMALKVSSTPAGRTQPYCAPVKAAAAAGAAPATPSGDADGKEDHGQANGHAPAPPKPGTCPPAARAGARPQMPAPGTGPAPGTCPVAPRPAVPPAASRPAVAPAAARPPALSPAAPQPAPPPAAARPPALSPATPRPAPPPAARPVQPALMLVPSTPAHTPKPCSPEPGSTPVISGPVAASPAPEPGTRPAAPVPDERPPAVIQREATARSSPRAADPAMNSIAPAVAIGAPAVRPGEPQRAPAARPVTRPTAQPGVIADDELESLLTSYLAEDEDTMEFR